MVEKIYLIAPEKIGTINPDIYGVFAEHIGGVIYDGIYCGDKAENVRGFRKEIIEKSMNEYGAVLLCNSREEAAQLANMVAPEHLEVLMENPMELLGALDNVGSLFLGAYASEPLGDYYAGPNHVLPTSGTARFFSPLGVQSFTKRSSYTYYTRDALREAKDDIVLIANKEGLTAHANAITVRFEDEQ